MVFPVARRMEVVLLFLAAACHGAAGAGSPPSPENAEFAMRWDPADGGPKSPEEVLTILGVPLPSAERYDVRYYDLPAPASAPAGATPILRERTRAGGKTEFRLKYRFTRPLAGGWACPAGEAFEADEEVDVSVGEGGAAARVYSYSCTLKAKDPPRSLNAVPKRCSAAMTRYSSGGFRVEEWLMPGGARTIEVSRPGTDAVDDLEKFRRVVEILLGRGARPSDRSKTELGSTCP
jgi:hypothetical protein